MPELPPPLPPGERTVGQLVAETIRLYGNNFLRALPLGIPIAIVSQLGLGHSANYATLALLALAPAVAAAFLAACWIVVGRRPSLTAFALALIVFAPVPILARAFVVPGLAWLAFFGLAVPAAMAEDLGFRAAFRRGLQLAAADYVHALGSLCALAIVVGISELTLIALLRSQGDNSQRAAHALADVVRSPMIYLGGAMLYFDQAARIGSRRPHRRRRRHADLHPPVDADPAGRADTQVEP
jgi:hypothetical protein